MEPHLFTRSVVYPSPTIFGICTAATPKPGEDSAVNGVWAAFVGHPRQLLRKARFYSQTTTRSGPESMERDPGLPCSLPLVCSRDCLATRAVRWRPVTGLAFTRGELYEVPSSNMTERR